MNRSRTLERISIAASLVATLFLTVPGAWAGAPSATCQIYVREGGKLDNASTSTGGIVSSDAGSKLRLGRRVTISGGDLAAESVRLGNNAQVGRVNADTLFVGKGASTGPQSGFAAGDFMCEAPEVACGGPQVFVPRNGAASLTPGQYDTIVLENSTTLTLAPGVYSVCEIRAGRHAKIVLGPGTPTTINVAGDFRLGNDSTFGASDVPIPALNVLGDVRIGAQSEVWAFIKAPNARLALGRNVTLVGDACARTLAGSRNVDIVCTPSSASSTSTTTSTSTTSTSATSTTSTSPTTTTTSSTTSTSTTTTTTTTIEEDRCGNGVIDEGEQCDPGSPGGALLACEGADCDDECQCDFGTTTTTTTSTSTTTTMEPTTTTSTSTSTTSTTTTSTTVTTSTTTTTTSTSTTTTEVVSTTTSTTSTTTTTLETCGNGVIDEGEQCDPGSPGGAFAACDGRPCTDECECDFGTTTTTTEASTTTTSTTVSTTTTSAPTTTEPTTTSTTTEPTTTSTTTEPTTTSTTTEPTTTSTTTEPTTTSTTTSSTTTTTQPVLPVAFDFTQGAAGGSCGNSYTDLAGTVGAKPLTCGGLSLGGGTSTIPENLNPDGGTNRFALSCTGSNCAIGPVNAAGPGFNCTNTGCFFGPPLELSALALTSCVVNTLAAPVSGNLDIATGTTSNLSINLTSQTFLQGLEDAAQPCPRCSATGTPAAPGTGTCNRGINAGLPCTSTNSLGLSTDCPPGGTRPAGSPLGERRCSVQSSLAPPTIERCADDSVNVGSVNANLTPLTTGEAFKAATAPPANPARFCGGLSNGCFAAAQGGQTCRSYRETGLAGGALAIGVPKPIRFASAFCVPATSNPTVNAGSALPGPGGTTLLGNIVLIGPQP